tara:strand:- start:4673 stop:4933 length:261 start_codon:yes stop_codon:yes gene_type:complete
MKIIVETETNLAKYAIDDDVSIESTATNITVGDPLQFTIADLNDTTTTVYANITNTPDDWAGNKYTFDGTTWAANANYVEPEAEEE